jgi:ribosomal protein S18 acetylase RimI-like enzyme
VPLLPRGMSVTSTTGNCARNNSIPRGACFWRDSTAKQTQHRVTRCSAASRAITVLMRSADDPRLDHVVYAALTGAQSRFAEVRGRAVRYAADVAPFLAVPREPSAQDWVDAAGLVPVGTFVAVQRPGDHTPDRWEVVREFEVVQMVEEHVRGIDDPEAVLLGRDDVPELLELVRETDPGPFLKRTIELGSYVGIRRGGELIAMAGERFHFEGWREISAVCTAPTHRAQGLASRLVNAVVCGTHRRSERAFLNVLSTNTDAIRLYGQLGFRVRARRTLSVMTPQGRSPLEAGVTSTSADAGAGADDGR